MTYTLDENFGEDTSDVTATMDVPIDVNVTGVDNIPVSLPAIVAIARRPRLAGPDDAGAEGGRRHTDFRGSLGQRSERTAFKTATTTSWLWLWLWP